jgi:hypothetical protein
MFRLPGGTFARPFQKFIDMPQLRFVLINLLLQRLIRVSHSISPVSNMILIARLSCLRGIY